MWVRQGKAAASWGAAVLHRAAAASTLPLRGNSPGGARRGPGR